MCHEQCVISAYQGEWLLHQQYRYKEQLMQQQSQTISPDEQFEMLVPEQPQEQYTLIPQFSSFVLNQANQPMEEQQNFIMDFVMEEETYLILDAVCKNTVCTQQEWMLFLQRKREHPPRFLQNKQVGPTRISYKQRNTAIGIRAEDLQKRKELWSICQPEITSQDMSEIDQQELFESVLAILPDNQIQALTKGVVKIKKILKAIIKEVTANKDAQTIYSPFWLQHLQTLQQNEEYIVKWVQNTLYRCAINFKKIRYCKGLQYICLGIILAYPELNFQRYSQIFTHFLTKNQFQDLYLEGSPRYYCQLRKISESLKQQNSQIYQKIQQLKGDSKNLFITYYRSCLLYRLKNPELIRKIFQLLLIEGIAAIKTIILRILQKMRKELLEGDTFLQTTASFLISEYFQDGKTNSQSIQKMIKDIFQM